MKLAMARAEGWSCGLSSRPPARAHWRRRVRARISAAAPSHSTSIEMIESPLYSTAVSQVAYYLSHSNDTLPDASTSNDSIQQDLACVNVYRP